MVHGSGSGLEVNLGTLQCGRGLKTTLRSLQVTQPDLAALANTPPWDKVCKVSRYTPLQNQVGASRLPPFNRISTTNLQHTQYLSQ